MKTILLMTVSADGYIARPNDEAPWSTEEFARCNEFVRKAGNVVVGRRTYEIMKEAGDFDETVQTVVLTDSSAEDIGNVHFVSSPVEAIEFLSSKNFETIVIAGGMTANGSFLDAGLIDEIIVDVEPTVLGKGFRLFTERDRDIKLKLIETTKLDERTVQLHYNLVK